MSDIDTVLVASLKALDPERPIREADISAPVRQGGFRVQPPGRISPRIGSFGLSGALGDFIHGLLPARLSLFHGLRGKGAIVGDRYERDCAIAGQLEYFTLQP